MSDITKFSGQGEVSTMEHVNRFLQQLGEAVKMVTGKIRADINFINPYPHAQIRARARARNPQQVENDTCTHYPRIPAYPRVRPHTRKF
jgi:hypothetical protein